MKFSTGLSLCLCALLMSVGLSQSSSTPEQSSLSTSTATVSSVTSSETSGSSTDSPTGSQSTSTASSSSAVNKTEADNSTNTNPTTQSTTTSTTIQTIVYCKNGSCSGNDSSCLNETITDTCELSQSQYCYQIEYTNSTDTFYEVGCRSSCEFLTEIVEEVTKTTRCCNTDLCNSELLSNPDPGNNATKLPVFGFPILLLLFLNWMLN